MGWLGSSADVGWAWLASLMQLWPAGRLAGGCLIDLVPCGPGLRGIRDGRDPGPQVADLTAALAESVSAMAAAAEQVAEGLGHR